MVIEYFLPRISVKGSTVEKLEKSPEVQRLADMISTVVSTKT